MYIYCIDKRSNNDWCRHVNVSSFHFRPNKNFVLYLRQQNFNPLNFFFKFNDKSVHWTVCKRKSFKCTFVHTRTRGKFLALVSGCNEALAKIPPRLRACWIRTLPLPLNLTTKTCWSRTGWILCRRFLLTKYFHFLSYLSFYYHFHRMLIFSNGLFQGISNRQWIFFFVCIFYFWNGNESFSNEVKCAEKFVLIKCGLNEKF